MPTFSEGHKIPNLLEFNWESIYEQLHKDDPKTDCFYMITINKGRDDEYRTRFMTYAEVLDLVELAVKKKRLRIPIATESTHS